MRELNKLLGPLSRRIRLIASRAVLSMVSDDKKMQGTQVNLLEGETRDGVERFQNYGFTSCPFAGAEGVFLSLNASRDQGVLIVVDDRRYRLAAMTEGEVAIYDDQGQKVHLTRDGIVIDGAGLPIKIQNTPLVDIDSPDVHMTGNLKVDGNIVADGDISDQGGTKSMSGMRDVHNIHTHDDPQGDTVSAPNELM